MTPTGVERGSLWRLAAACAQRWHVERILRERSFAMLRAEEIAPAIVVSEKPTKRLPRAA